MSEIFCDDPAIFMNGYMLAAPRGSRLFHGQLADDYPSDRQRRAELAAADRPISELVEAGYKKFLERARGLGLAVARLVVVRDDREPQFLQELQETLAPVQALGEHVRVTKFGRFAITLERSCGDSPMVGRYIDSFQEGSSPKEGFWAIQSPAGPVQTTWSMNYDGDRFAGGPIHSPVPAGRLCFVECALGVFSDRQASLDLDDV